MAADSNSIIKNLYSKFKYGDIVIRLLYLNIGVFLIISLCGLICTLFNLLPVRWVSYLMFPASVERFAYQPWSIFSYMFVHVDVFHVLFNMIWLYWFGRLFLDFFSSKHLCGLYILGGVMGALAYMLAYHVFPYFSNSVDVACVTGASASVLAIVVAVAVREPNYAINFMFIGRVRLKYIALFMIVFDVLFVTSDNAGGHIAHLGGALAGWLFASALAKGTDMTRWINAALDFRFVGRKPKVKKPKMKVHYGTGKKKENNEIKKNAHTAEIDAILDKLRKSGYNNLTDDEKKKLFDLSKK